MSGGAFDEKSWDTAGIEATFRQQSARLVSVLVRAFGPSRLTLVEDVVQEAFVRAVHLWPAKGVPANPEGWLTKVAYNLAVDAMRRENIYVPESASVLDSVASLATDLEVLGDAEIEMLFLCCHPALPVESQIALTLRELCGLSTREVAKGLMQSEDAVAQRLVRAKKSLIGIDMSADEQCLSDRLDSVLRVLYLMFNEGYSAHTDPLLVRSELCDEAILLAGRVSKTSMGDRPVTHALLALMLLHSSRLPARVASDGSLCLLEDQDRALWDHARIAEGMRRLARSAQGRAPSQYHFEAGIAAAHAGARTFGHTDWLFVLCNYDLLAALNPSPVVLLNRAIAVTMVHGPRSGLDQLEAIQHDKTLRAYYLLPATKARFMEMLGQVDEARLELGKALELAQNPCEKQFLTKKLTQLKS